MWYESLGNTEDVVFSKIILGTWQAGKSMWADIQDSDTVEAIRTAVDIGMTTIDTAAVYGDGHSERIIAQALKGVPRTKYQIATKVYSDKLKYKQVLEECEKSLGNLRTDFVELYQVHWPSGSFGSDIVPIEETMSALNQLKQEGKILNIGVSNFSQKQIEEAQKYADILSNQPPYSLIWRAYDNSGTNRYCRENDISILAYSPLAQGILCGKFHKGHIFKENDHRSKSKLMQYDVLERVEQVLQGLQKYADKYKTSLGNIALNWLISQPKTFAIVGVRNAEQVRNNSKACQFKLTSEEFEELDSLSRVVTQNMEQREDEPMWNF